MKKLCISFLVLSWSFCVLGKNKQAAGIILGSPTGLSYHYYLNDKNSLDAGLDYRLGDKVNIHSTYLWHMPQEIKVFGQVMGWYYGAGARIKSVAVEDDETELRIGARGSAGLLWAPTSQPFELFAEGAGVMNMIPGTSFDGIIALGARFVF